jgi:hypothetical protein
MTVWIGCDDSRKRADLPYIILLLVNAVLFFVLLAARCSRANPLRITGGSPKCAQDSLRKHCLDSSPPVLHSARFLNGRWMSNCLAY